MKVRGRIVSFDLRTWWGEAVYDLTVVPFHGVCLHGMHTDVNPAGLRCDLLFNDDGNLFAVWLVSFADLAEENRAAGGCGCAEGTVLCPH